MDPIICNSGIIRRIKFNMPKLTEFTINFKLFMEGCKNIAAFLGYFGMALRSIQYIIFADLELIIGFYKENDDYTREDLVMMLAKEIEKDETNINQATYHLMKCLIFTSRVMSCLVGECEEESLVSCIEEAYLEILAPFQNKLPNWLFRVLVKTCRSKNEVIERLVLEDDSSENEMKATICSAVEVINHAVNMLKEYFQKRWRNTDCYFL